MATSNRTKVPLRTVLVIGLLMGVCDCLRPPYRTESKEVGRRVRNNGNGPNPQPAHELGFGHYYQGDIILPSVNGQNRLSLTDDQSLWPNATVPYYIRPDSFSLREIRTIERAMNVFHTKTCVRFVPRTPLSPYYVTITSRESGCFASLGRVSDNKQNVINLQRPDCLRSGTPVHEMMHVLGFLHEMSRPDRDEYLFINRSALRPEYQTDQFFNDNFMKEVNGVETFNISYNYGSIMHYTKYAGAESRAYPVLVNLKPYDEPDFGNYTLSPSDIEAVKFRYCRNATVGLFSVVDRELVRLQAGK